jgi:hypothetical protein
MVGERPGQRLAIDKQLVSDIGSKSRLWDYGVQTYPEEKFVDHVVADRAIKSLGEKKKKPFFPSRRVLPAPCPDLCPFAILRPPAARRN